MTGARQPEPGRRASSPYERKGDKVHGDAPDENPTCRTIATVIFDNAEAISVFQKLHPEAKDITNDPAYELDVIWYNQAFPESN